MTRRATIWCAALTVLVAACGGSDDGTDGGAATAPDTAAVATDAVPSTDAAPGTEPSDSGAPSAGGGADCLPGTWVADATEQQRRVDQLGVPIELTVGPESVSNLTMTADTFTVENTVSLSAEIPGTGVRLSSQSSGTVEGTYTVDGERIVATVTSQVNEPSTWSASLNGTPIELPDAGLGEPPDASFDFNGSTFACTAESLTFDVIGSEFGTITYTRSD